MSAPFAAEVRTAAGNAAWKAISLPFERLCRFLLVAVSMRTLGTAAYGRFRFATTATLMLAMVVDLGLGVWTVRELARSRARAATIARTVLKVRLVAGAPYLVLTAILALVVGPGETRNAVLLLGLAGLISAVIDHAIALFRGYERFSDEARVNVARALLLLGGALGGLWFQRSAVGLSVGILAGTAAAGLYALWVVRRGYHLLATTDQGGYDPAVARTALRDGLPICLAGLISTLYFKGDTVLLMIFASDVVLGIYSAAYAIFETSLQLPAILLAAAFPPLARANLDRQRQRQWERLVSGLLLALGLLVAAVCYVARGPIIALVSGGGFAAAGDSLRILALGIPLMYVNFGLTHFLIARDLGRRNMLFSGMMLVLNVALNLVAIPRFGALGAAWTTVLTEAALTVCCLVALAPQRYSGARPALAVSPSVSQKRP
jgi:O-antigen/teichoic acid export membrane protein